MAGKNTYYGGIYGAREYSINADTANTAIDLSQSNVYNISLSATTTISFLNPTSTHYIFIIEQTAGSNTITWPDIKWKSGVPPTLSTTIGSKDTVSIIYDGEEYYGFSTDYQTGFRLLDYYPDAAAAYSLRDLSQDWIGQPVVRVRRSSDNAEADFTATEVTDGTLTTWTGANDGYVVTWYDQSGAWNNATQSTADNQPKIVSSGVVNVSNGLPALDYDGTNDILTSLAFSAGGASMATVAICEFASGSLIQNIVDQDPQSGTRISQNIRTSSASVQSIVFDPGAKTDTGTPNLSIGSQYILWAIRETSSIEIYVNSSTNGSTSAGTQVTGSVPVAVGGSLNLGAGQFWAGNIQEVIIWNISQSANRAAIESDINTHYSIY